MPPVAIPTKSTHGFYDPDATAVLASGSARHSSRITAETQNLETSRSCTDQHEKSNNAKTDDKSKSADKSNSETIWESRDFAKD